MKQTGLEGAGPPKTSKFKAWRQNRVVKIADSTDMYKQHPTLFDFSVIVSKNVSISGNLLCVFKLSKSDGCPFLLKSFMKLKYKRWGTQSCTMNVGLYTVGANSLQCSLILERHG